ncbi:GH25 family lysozyme [Enterococcus faecalis]
MAKVLKSSLWGMVTVLAVSTVPLVSAEEMTTSSTSSSTAENTVATSQEQNTGSTTESENITSTTESKTASTDTAPSKTSESSDSKESSEGQTSSSEPAFVKGEKDEEHAMGGKTYTDHKRTKRSAVAYSMSILDQNLPSADFIDVSSWNGEITVDMYKKLKSYGVKGVVVKLTEGAPNPYRNEYARSQINNAKAAGLKVSAYHFARYFNASEARAEANEFVRYAKELGLGPETIMVNDIEKDDTLTSAATDNSLAFAAQLRALGYGNVIHYSYAAVFNSGILNVARLGGPASVWIAQYPYTPSKNNLLHTNYAAWQWASTMTFPGVNAPIPFDVSIDYTKRFTAPNTPLLDMTYRAGDVVLFGDWNGDGKDTVAIKRGNTFYFKNSLAGGNADIVLTFGNPTDEALVGDWNGDGKDTIAVRRGNVFFFKNSLTPGNEDVRLAYGNPTDDAVAGDWNGSGKDSIAVRRGNTFFFKNNLIPGNENLRLSYGNSSDQILVGDWTKAGKDSIAVRRGNTTYVKYNLTPGFDDLSFSYGNPNDKAFAGDWNGNGQDTLLVQQGSAFQVRNSLSGGWADLSFKLEE